MTCTSIGRRRTLSALIAFIFCSIAVGLSTCNAAVAPSDFSQGIQITDANLKGADSEVPVVGQEQLVYGLTLFDGKQYQWTLCPEDVKTAYVISDTRNTILAKRAKVYFWPITGEYVSDWDSATDMTDPSELSMEVLTGSKLVTTLRPQKYAMMYRSGYMGPATEILLDEAAQTEFDRYMMRLEEYGAAISQHYQAYMEYTKAISDFIDNPTAFDGKIPREPAEPAPPQVCLSQVYEAFIIDLPEGSYRIRLKDGAGNVVPGSERAMIAFSAVGRGIGYQVIPEDKWTYPSTSDDMSQNITALKDQVIYVKPYEEVSFNRHHYAKLTELHRPTSGRGMENQTFWTYVRPLEARDEMLSVEVVSRKGVVSTTVEKPYHVEQTSGSSLGYSIIEFSPETCPEPSPDFTAFKIEMPQTPGRYCLRIVNESGQVLDDSTRELRIVQGTDSSWIQTTAFIPLVVGAFMVINRRRKCGTSRRKAIMSS